MTDRPTQAVVEPQEPRLLPTLVEALDALREIGDALDGIIPPVPLPDDSNRPPSGTRLEEALDVAAAVHTEVARLRERLRFLVARL